MKLKVSDVMTHDVATVQLNDKLAVADDVMRLGRIRHMPVVDEDGELAGIVSQRDLFHNALLQTLGYGTRAKQQAMDLCTVKDAMVSQVITIAPDALLSEAARMMVEKKIGSIVVVDDGKIAGILTESDFVKLALEGDAKTS